MSDPHATKKHERRVIGHASGWKEQMNTCVCGEKWPCLAAHSSHEHTDLPIAAELKALPKMPKAERPYPDAPFKRVDDSKLIAALEYRLAIAERLLRDIAGHPMAHEADCDYEDIGKGQAGTIIKPETCNCGCDDARTYLSWRNVEGNNHEV